MTAEELNCAAKIGTIVVINLLSVILPAVQEQWDA